MKTSFKIGELVRIKSAGLGFPVMTIENIEEAGGVTYITCIWWNNQSAKYDKYTFNEETLVKS